MLRSDKEPIVAELVDRLRASETLIVADYRGLTVKQVDELRTQLLQHGARFTIVKNSLTRRAAEAAGADALLALLDGPTAIAFIEAGGDAVAVAKAIADTARTTRILAVRGGIMEGRAISADTVQQLAKLPPVDVLRGQVLGAITAPVYAIVGLFSAPLRDLHGLIQARIDQLGGEGAAGASEPVLEASEPVLEESSSGSVAEATDSAENEENDDTSSPVAEATGEGAKEE